MADELTRMSAAGLAAAIAGGEVSALEVTDAHLARILRANQRGIRGRAAIGSTSQ